MSDRRLLAGLLAALLAACAAAPPPPRTPYDVPSDLPDEAAPAQRSLRALKIHRQAQRALLTGAPGQAVALFHQALMAYRDLGDLTAQAAIHNDLALIANANGEPDKALTILQDGLALARQGGDPTVIAENLYNRGVVLYDLRRDADAADAFNQALAVAREHSNDELIGLASNALGNVHRRSDQLTPAAQRYTDALRAWNKLRRPLLAAVALQNLAYTHILQGALPEATQALVQATDLLTPLPGPDAAILLPHLQELLRLVRANPDTAREKVLQVLGRGE